MHARVASVDVIGTHDLVGRIRKRGARLSASRVDEVLAAMLPPRVRADDPTLDDELTDQLLDGVLEAPIEDWMAFLDPAQAKLVRRSFNGPARIRGAAGTGKIVVGLHRAAYLARSTSGRILFTTYIGTLPKVLESLLERLAPDMVGRVDFVGVRRFATRLLKERGIAFRVSGREARLAFDDAWNAIRASSQLRSSRFSRSYWEDEIKHVIKGAA